MLAKEREVPQREDLRRLDSLVRKTVSWVAPLFWAAYDPSRKFWRKWMTEWLSCHRDYEDTSQDQMRIRIGHGHTRRQLCSQHMQVRAYHWDRWPWPLTTEVCEEWRRTWTPINYLNERMTPSIIIYAPWWPSKVDDVRLSCRKRQWSACPFFPFLPWTDWRANGLSKLVTA